jgi:hypothetical protein
VIKSDNHPIESYFVRLKPADVQNAPTTLKSVTAQHLDLIIHLAAIVLEVGVDRPAWSLALGRVELTGLAAAQTSPTTPAPGPAATPSGTVEPTHGTKAPMVEGQP